MKKNKVLLSICIPVYNRYKLLKKLLNSIKTKNNSSIEVIIIDDGSKEPIKSLFNSINTKFKKRYFYQKNQGVAHAMIKAYKKASGTYCVKMDTDDIFLPNGVDYILNVLHKNFQNFKKNKKICGIIFGTKLVTKNKIILNNLPDNKITNFLALRADLNNFYDCKEVVKREVILKRQIPIPKINRVVQQSWLTMANHHDCITSSLVVAKKSYLEGGLSDHSAIGYKVKEAKILAKMNFLIARSKRYKSKKFKFRAEILKHKYSLHANINKINNLRTLFYTALAIPFFLHEKFIFNMLGYTK